MKIFLFPGSNVQSTVSKSQDVLSLTLPESVRVKESRVWKGFGVMIALFSAWLADTFLNLTVSSGKPFWLGLAYVAGNVALVAVLTTQVWLSGSSVRCRGTRIGLAIKVAGVNVMVALVAYPLALARSAGLALAGIQTGLGQGALASAKEMGAPVVTTAGIAWYVLSCVLWATGLALIRFGYRHDALVESKRESIDPRPCVLYLRSFMHDDTSLLGARLGKWRGWRLWRAWWPPTSFEQDLASVLSGIGPLVTVGRPGEQLPQLGAQRLYFEDHEWQPRVTELMTSAALVVIRCGSTGNLWWELDQALRYVSRSRLIVLSLGSDVERGTFEAQFEQRFGFTGALTSLPPVHVPFLLKLALLGRTAQFGRLVAFSESSAPTIVPVRAGFNPLRFFQIYLQFTPYRHPLLTAFRKAFEVRKLHWMTPAPRRSLALYLSINFGFFGLHHFYLGQSRKGWLSLAFCCTCIPQLVSLANAVQMLWMNQDEFARRYVPNWGPSVAAPAPTQQLGTTGSV